MEKSIEQRILERTHSAQDAAKVLAEKYSMTGEKKPYLVLGSTMGGGGGAGLGEEMVGLQATKTSDPNNAVKNLARDPQRGKKTKKVATAKFKLAKPRAALRKYISELRNGTQKLPYDQVKSLNALWQEYMKELIFDNNTNNGNGNGNGNSDSIVPRDATQKLASADFQGAEVTVTSARNPSLVGTKGIVIWDCKSCFVMACSPTSGLSHYTRSGKPHKKSKIVQHNPKQGNLGAGDMYPAVIKIIHKAGAQFGFELSSEPECAVNSTEGEDGNQPSIRFSFDIIGSRFCFRTADRAARKFKNRSVDDLV